MAVKFAPINCISIHAPARGATKDNRQGASGRSISIHAPARGATINLRSDMAETNISIHAPARGATLYGVELDPVTGFQSTLPREERQAQAGCTDDTWYFNPRSRERSDDETEAEHPDNAISIHAPARGATCWKSTADHLRQFQSTLPREERHPTINALCGGLDFNPRSRERSDAGDLHGKIRRL